MPGQLVGVQGDCDLHAANGPRGCDRTLLPRIHFCGKPGPRHKDVRRHSLVLLYRSPHRRQCMLYVAALARVTRPALRRAVASTR